MIAQQGLLAGFVIDEAHCVRYIALLRSMKHMLHY